MSKLLPLMGIFCFQLMMLCSVTALAQNNTVHGIVRDADTGETLPGVNIRLKGTSTGTSTDANGKYLLQVQALNDTLMVSFVGYKTLTIPINGRTSINVELNSQTIVGKEIVLVGYGTQSTRELSSSVSKVDAEDLSDQPAGQITQKLQGKISGVQISQTTGTPGEGMDIRIRGAASITGGHEPLYVVDGNPVVGGIDNINPSEIESISVLKDAAATSLYGSRASNGVVLIETKEAESGETRIEYNTHVGFQQVPQRGRPDMMNAREFAEFKKEIAEVNGNAVDPVYQNPSQYREGTDWFDAVTKKGLIQDHNLTVSTGSDNFSTTATAGFFQQDGVVVGSGYKRYSLRVNTDFHPNNNLNIGINIAPSRTDNTNSNRYGGIGADINETLQTSPLAPLKNPDGSLTLTASSPGMFATPNYVRTLKDRNVDNDETRILGNMYLEYNILKGVTIKTSGDIDRGESRNFVFNPTTTGTRGVGLYKVPFSSLYEQKYLSWVNENTLKYQKDIGDHSIDVLLGFTAQKFHQDISIINADDYPDNKIETIGAATTVNASSDVQEWSLLSYLTRLNYNYKGKYLLSASIRRDGSSRFGEENRWGNFPAVSVGWIMSEENFMQDIKPISFLKLRVSYGITGNFNIGNYTHIPTVSTSNYVFGDNIAAGRYVNNLADQGLGWESNKELNIGIDVNLLNDHIKFTYNYYQRRTSDLLFNVSIPRASGFSNLQTNIGELRFWGHEFSINTSNIESKNLEWATDFNISFDRNSVVSIGTKNSSLFTGPSSYLFEGNHITKVGQPIGMLYGMVHQGVYVNQEDFENSPKGATSEVGTAKFRDVNGDGVITLDDATTIGNPHPDFIFGITNRLRYRKFDFSISISGTYGNKKLRASEQTLTNLDGVFNVLSNVQDHWRSPQAPGSGRYGKLVAGTTGMERDWWGTQMLYDASHLTIKNITLGYNIPVDNKILRGLRVYGSVQEVYVFTNYPGGNPEVSQSQASTGLGIDSGAYPLPRTYTLGVNIDF